MASRAPKRTKADKENDRREISELYLKGFSLRKIAGIISSRRKYSLTYVQIKFDIDKIVKAWQEEGIANIEKVKVTELQKLNKVENAAWIGYEETKVSKFLEIVLKCIEKRCKIFGIEQVTEDFSQRQIVVVNLPAPIAEEVEPIEIPINKTA